MGPLRERRRCHRGGRQGRHQRWSVLAPRAIPPPPRTTQRAFPLVRRQTHADAAHAPPTYIVAIPLLECQPPLAPSPVDDAARSTPPPPCRPRSWLSSHRWRRFWVLSTVAPRSAATPPGNSRRGRCSHSSDRRPRRPPCPLNHGCRCSGAGDAAHPLSAPAAPPAHRARAAVLPASTRPTAIAEARRLRLLPARAAKGGRGVECHRPSATMRPHWEITTKKIAKKNTGQQCRQKEGNPEGGVQEGRRRNSATGKRPAGLTRSARPQHCRRRPGVTRADTRR